ncbi:helix-turn-helix domain-containing protein [Streptomyces sp. NPDC058674]|uniref:helix-turn-helix domain-containing protein n=1 Tax=Streptomyces sp. NPDC058674 TaxID=3346592 RepID=UPI00365B1094
MRRLLGAALVRHRTAYGLTGDDVVRAGAVSSPAKLSRIENGASNVRFSEDDIRRMLDLYEVPREGEEYRSVMMRAQLVLDTERPWWWRHKGVVAAAFSDLLHVEGRASEIQTYEGNYVPGLLQTTAYMNAVFEVPKLDEAGNRTELEQRRDVRKQRQQLLERTDPPEFTALIDEALLRRPFGGPAVMREQLRYLFSLCENRDRVHIRVFPTSAWGICPPLTTAMTLLKLPEAEGPSEMLYVEAANVTAVWVEERLRLEEHRASLHGVLQHALGKADTLRFLQARIDDLVDQS